MSNGASGCGYEYRNTGGRCQFLDKLTCLKYKEALTVNARTNEPVRLKTCANDAALYWVSRSAAERKAQTVSVRSQRGQSMVQYGVLIASTAIAAYIVIGQLNLSAALTPAIKVVDHVQNKTR